MKMKTYTTASELIQNLKNMIALKTCGFRDYQLEKFNDNPSISKLFMIGQRYGVYLISKQKDNPSAFYVKDCRYIIREVVTKHYNITLGKSNEIKRYINWVETASEGHLTLFLELAQKVGYSFCFGYKGMLQDIQLFGFPPPYNNTKISHKEKCK